MTSSCYMEETRERRLEIPKKVWGEHGWRDILRGAKNTRRVKDIWSAHWRQINIRYLTSISLSDHSGVILVQIYRIYFLIRSVGSACGGTKFSKNWLEIGVEGWGRIFSLIDFLGWVIRIVYLGIQRLSRRANDPIYHSHLPHPASVPNAYKANQIAKINYFHAGCHFFRDGPIRAARD